MKEQFKDIKGYEGLYQVSNFGNVKSLQRKGSLKGRILKPGLSTRGYLMVILHTNAFRKARLIHQLVAEAFLNHTPNGMKIVVDHLDFDRINNHVDNLRLISNRENTNQKHMKSTSKYVGVHWYKLTKKWRARIHVNGKRKHIGYYTDELVASKAYQNELAKIKKQNEL